MYLAQALLLGDCCVAHFYCNNSMQLFFPCHNHKSLIANPLCICYTVFKLSCEFAFNAIKSVNIFSFGRI